MSILYQCVSARLQYGCSTCVGLHTDAGRTVSGLEKRVVVVGLYDLGSDEAVEWNPLMASVVVAIIPVVILFTLVRRCLTGVLTGSRQRPASAPLRVPQATGSLSSDDSKTSG